MANRLANETSPYLQQHAENPVDWYPWGEEALARARREDRPILLSIGYSACHWCHVMAHESFEDAGEAGHPSRVVGRVVGPAEEGLQVGGEEDRHRPAALPGHRLDGRHVDLIDVGTLLAVDLDVDERGIHERRDPGVFEALPLHDVAPVAGGVADREEDRTALSP